MYCMIKTNNFVFTWDDEWRLWREKDKKNGGTTTDVIKIINAEEKAWTEIDDLTSRQAIAIWSDAIHGGKLSLSSFDFNLISNDELLHFYIRSSPDYPEKWKILSNTPTKEEVISAVASFKAEDSRRTYWGRG